MTTFSPILDHHPFWLLVDRAVVTFHGHTDGAATVTLTVNGAARQIRSDGKFHADVALEVGLNELVFSTVGADGADITETVPIIRLITDRTQADVDALMSLLSRGMANWTAEELAEFNRIRSRGGYNYTDLNRVTLATGYLSEAMGQSGYYVPLTAKNDWVEKDAPRVSDLAAYLADVETIRKLLPLPPDAPDVPPDMRRLQYQEANDIEKILVLVDGLYAMSDLSYWYSGEIYSGEV